MICFAGGPAYPAAGGEPDPAGNRLAPAQVTGTFSAQHEEPLSGPRVPAAVSAPATPSPCAPAWEPDPEMEALLRQFAERPNREDALRLADTAYRVASRRQRCGSSRSVDFFYQAAAFGWYCLRKKARQDPASLPRDPALASYNRSLARLIETAQHYGRLDARRKLLIDTPAGRIVVPVGHRGFSWRPEDFHRVRVVGCYDPGDLTCIYRRSGLGVPLLVFRHRTCAGDPREQFLRPCHPFAATAVLRPALRPLLPLDVGADRVRWGRETHPEGGGEIHAERGMTLDEPARLELYDPLEIYSIPVEGGAVPLAGDVTAPLVNLAQPSTRRGRVGVGFRQRNARNEFSGLRMCEPHRPGKIPVVMVHGLLSGPCAWLNVANSLRGDPALAKRYEPWVLAYTSGDPFLHTAAALRADLDRAAEVFDPEGRDPALSEIVLIGSSMGGLIARMMVTRSDAELWNALSRKPLESLRIDPAFREQLAEAFFFEPYPRVKCVVFVGTPHRGSPLANGLTRRLGGRLVPRTPELRAAYDRMMRDNPGAFPRGAPDMAPSSVDLLGTRNPYIQAIQRMEFSPEVKLHSIIAIRRDTPLGRHGDGVVPVFSARLPQAESECFVISRHGKISQKPATVREVKRILREHLAEAGSAHPGRLKAKG
jgi:pimeloyl-ACP methyl ester carboxylesterase